MTKAQCPPLASIYYETFGHKTDGVFVEVGAFNGVNWSATRALAELGWSGVMFEPQQDRYNECNELYANNDKVSVERCAILDYIGETRLYLGGSLSTTRPSRVLVYQDVWWAKSSRLDLERYEIVPVYTLSYWLDKYDIPADFEVLIVDVEGAETQVLNSIEWDRWHPQVMMVETHEKEKDERLSAEAEKIDKIAFSHGYEKIFSNHINTVYK